MRYSLNKKECFTLHSNFAWIMCNILLCTYWCIVATFKSGKVHRSPGYLSCKKQIITYEVTLAVMNLKVPCCFATVHYQSITIQTAVQPGIYKDNLSFLSHSVAQALKANCLRNAAHRQYLMKWISAWQCRIVEGQCLHLYKFYCNEWKKYKKADRTALDHWMTLFLSILKYYKGLH